MCDHNCRPVGADLSQGSLNVLLRLGVQGRRGLERYCRQGGLIGVQIRSCSEAEPRQRCKCTGVKTGGLGDVILCAPPTSSSRMI